MAKACFLVLTALLLAALPSSAANRSLHARWSSASGPLPAYRLAADCFAAAVTGPPPGSRRRLRLVQRPLVRRRARGLGLLPPGREDRALHGLDGLQRRQQLLRLHHRRRALDNMERPVPRGRTIEELRASVQVAEPLGFTAG
jgi:hypothetical protein